MQRARMPEASIHKHRDPLCGKHDVRATPDGRLRLAVLPEAQASTMQRGPQGDLGPGILARLPCMTREAAIELGGGWTRGERGMARNLHR